MNKEELDALDYIMCYCEPEVDLMVKGQTRADRDFLDALNLLARYLNERRAA